MHLAWNTCNWNFYINHVKAIASYTFQYLQKSFLPLNKVSRFCDYGTWIFIVIYNIRYKSEDRVAMVVMVTKLLRSNWKLCLSYSNEIVKNCLGYQCSKRGSAKYFFFIWFKLIRPILIFCFIGLWFLTFCYIHHSRYS